MRSLIAAASAFWAGVVIRGHSESVRFGKWIADFVPDMWAATVGVPHEMRRLWHDAHTLTPYLQGGKLNHDAGRTDVSTSAQDYVLWRRLGVASDLFIALPVMTIVLVVVAAVL